MEDVFKKYGFKKAVRYGKKCYDKKDTKIGHIIIIEKSKKFNVCFINLKNSNLKSDLFSVLSKNNEIIPVCNETKKDALNEFLNNLLYLENPILANNILNK